MQSTDQQETDQRDTHQLEFFKHALKYQKKVLNHNLVQSRLILVKIDKLFAFEVILKYIILNLNITTFQYGDIIIKTSRFVDELIFSCYMLFCKEIFILIFVGWVLFVLNFICVIAIMGKAGALTT